MINENRNISSNVTTVSDTSYSQNTSRLVCDATNTSLHVNYSNGVAIENLVDAYVQNPSVALHDMHSYSMYNYYRNLPSSIYTSYYPHSTPVEEAIAANTQKSTEVQTSFRQARVVSGNVSTMPPVPSRMVVNKMHVPNPCSTIPTQNSSDNFMECSGDIQHNFNDMVANDMLADNKVIRKSRPAGKVSANTSNPQRAAAKNSWHKENVLWRSKSSTIQSKHTNSSMSTVVDLSTLLKSNTASEAQARNESIPSIPVKVHSGCSDLWFTKSTHSPKEGSPESAKNNNKEKSNAFSEFISKMCARKTVHSNTDRVKFCNEQTQTDGPYKGRFRLINKYPKIEELKKMYSDDNENPKKRFHICEQTRVIIARVFEYNKRMAEEMGTEAIGTPWKHPLKLTSEMCGFSNNTIKQCADTGDKLFKKCTARQNRKQDGEMTKQLKYVFRRTWIQNCSPSSLDSPENDRSDNDIQTDLQLKEDERKSAIESEDDLISDFSSQRSRFRSQGSNPEEDVADQEKENIDNKRCVDDVYQNGASKRRKTVLKNENSSVLGPEDSSISEECSFILNEMMKRVLEEEENEQVKKDSGSTNSVNSSELDEFFIGRSFVQNSTITNQNLSSQEDPDITFANFKNATTFRVQTGSLFSPSVYNHPNRNEGDHLETEIGSIGGTTQALSSSFASLASSYFSAMDVYNPMMFNVLTAPWPALVPPNSVTSQAAPTFCYPSFIINPTLPWAPFFTYPQTVPSSSFSPISSDDESPIQQVAETQSVEQDELIDVERVENYSSS